MARRIRGLYDVCCNFGICLLAFAVISGSVAFAAEYTPYRWTTLTPKTDLPFSRSYSLVVTANGTIYLTSPYGGLNPASLLYKIDPDGTVTQDNRFVACSRVAQDASGNLYIYRSALGLVNVKRIDAAGTVTDVADLSDVTARGFAVAPNGDLYLSAQSDYCIWKWSNGTFARFAGTSGRQLKMDGAGLAAGFFLPSEIISTADGDMFISDGNAIRKMTPAGVVTTVAGGRPIGDVDGPAASSGMNSSDGPSRGSDGTLFFTSNFVVRKVAPDGYITTLGGRRQTPAIVDGDGEEARFYTPYYTGVDAAGTIYVTDATPEGKFIIRKGVPILPPTIVAQPISQQVSTGTRVEFSVTVSGTPNFTYQWYINDVSLAGQTASTLVIPNATQADRAGYTCKITNSAGSVISERAQLTFAALPLRIVTEPDAQTVLLGTKAEFRIVVESAVSFQWYKDNILLPGATSAVLTIPSAAASDAGEYTCKVTGTADVLTSRAAKLTVTTVKLPAKILIEPDSKAALPGSAVEFRVTAENAVSYQWYKGDAAIPGATSGTLTIASVKASDAGQYSCRVTGATGVVTSRIVSLWIGITDRLTNISTLSNAGTGEAVQIGGFVIGGLEPMQVVVRAGGPALGIFDVPNRLADPHLALFDGKGAFLASNDDWDFDAIDAKAKAVGAYDWTKASKDAALALTLAPGAYTAHVTGKAGASGAALIEVYCADPAPKNNRLINISTRSRLAVAGEPQIAGFVIAGAVPRRVLVRASGPGLALLDMKDYLADPSLAVLNHKNEVLETNEDWDAAKVRDVSDSLGAFKWTVGSKDAAILITLNPGQYTAHVRGKGASVGVTLIEVYEVDP